MSLFEDADAKADNSSWLRVYVIELEDDGTEHWHPTSDDAA